MNKLHLFLSIAALALMLAASPLLQAGPGPQYWKNAPAAAKPVPAVTAAPAASATRSCAQCQNCATCCVTKPQVKQAS